MEDISPGSAAPDEARSGGPGHPRGQVPGRVLIHVQHLVGVGHQRRMAVIARELSLCGVDVTYVSGGVSVPGLDIGGARLVQLPPAKVCDGDYSTLADGYGDPVDERWRDARREQLLNVFTATQPDCLLIVGASSRLGCSTVGRVLSARHH